MLHGTEHHATIQSPVAHTKRRSKAAVPDEVDVAIIGAGPGGLVSGAYLAKLGLSVAVFDAHYVAGGCATMFERGTKDARYNFDIGLHYIGDCGPNGAIPRLLRGVDIDLVYEPMDASGFDEIILPNRRFRIPVNREEYEQRLLEAFPNERKGIRTYCRLLREVELLGSLMGSGASKFQLIKDVVFKGASRQSIEMRPSVRSSTTTFRMPTYVPYCWVKVATMAYAPPERVPCCIVVCRIIISRVPITHVEVGKSLPTVWRKRLNRTAGTYCCVSLFGTFW